MAVKNTEKAKKDLKIAEIVYYSIGGLVLLLGVVFSIFGLILLNPLTENFEDFWLKQAEVGFFEFLKLDYTFASAGIILMSLAVIYFIIVFAIFTRKGDQVDRVINSKKSRQRQIIFNNPTDEVVETVEE